jgi:hypothetical protein
MMAGNNMCMTKTTVRQLIEHLFKAGDLDQPVLYQYYLAEHFDLELEDKVWSQVVEEFDSLIPGMASCSELISEALLAQVINNQRAELLEIRTAND